jgi:hypothetical protein
MTRSRKALASLLLAGVLFTGACSDDDDDGNPELDVPEDVEIEDDDDGNLNEEGEG